MNMMTDAPFSRGPLSAGPVDRLHAYALLLVAAMTGLPAPIRVEAHDASLNLRFAFNDRASVEAWAAHLGLMTPVLTGKVQTFKRGTMVNYRSRRRNFPALPGWSVSVGCMVDVVADELPVDEPVEHYMVAGEAGGPGECSATCACGTTYAGFNTLAEATAELTVHISETETPEPATDPRRRPHALIAAGIAAGLPIPTVLEIYTASRAQLGLTFDVGALEAVDAWSTFLGLPTPGPIVGTFLLPDAEVREAYGSRTTTHPALPGFLVEVVAGQRIEGLDR
ncbi:hypothetical protein ACIBF5_15890 [Micromonospora sp. NPDC050417]|uniref:hypothetical protein n=1 Tax=Micromonospora sp. NPDC050417 TaxID=3364280 RepID=UPI00379B3803